MPNSEPTRSLLGRPLCTWGGSHAFRLLAKEKTRFRSGNDTQGRRTGSSPLWTRLSSAWKRSLQVFSQFARGRRDPGWLLSGSGQGEKCWGFRLLLLTFPILCTGSAFPGARSSGKPVFRPYFTLMQTHLNHRLVFRRLLLVNGAINPGCQAGWSGAWTPERDEGAAGGGGRESERRKVPPWAAATASEWRGAGDADLVSCSLEAKSAFRVKSCREPGMLCPGGCAPLPGKASGCWLP